MLTVKFTSHLERFLEAPPEELSATTVGEALNQIFEKNPQLKSYILDDQGSVRKHVAIFIDGKMIEDRDHLSDAVSDTKEVFVMQALSGG